MQFIDKWNKMHLLNITDIENSFASHFPWKYTCKLFSGQVKITCFQTKRLHVTFYQREIKWLVVKPITDFLIGIESVKEKKNSKLFPFYISFCWCRLWTHSSFINIQKICLIRFVCARKWNNLTCRKILCALKLTKYTYFYTQWALSNHIKYKPIRFVDWKKEKGNGKWKENRFHKCNHLKKGHHFYHSMVLQCHWICTHSIWKE